MILSKEEIQEEIESGAIIISPKPQDEQYSSSSLDLHLGDEFYYWDPEQVGTGGVETQIRLNQADFIKIAPKFRKSVPRLPDGTVLLEPKQFMLAITKERVELPLSSALAARVEGRSSLARWGVQVHLTAPTIHAGWNGKITLELLNHGPFIFRLAEDDKLCQLVFERLGRPAEEPPQTGFQGQTTPIGY